jgi:tetratricopeptide (TPR) repeat protein
MKEMDKADQFVENQAKQKDNAIGTQLLIANYYLYRQQFSVADKHFNDIINSSSDEVNAYYGLAQSKQLQQDWPGAFKQYNQIITLYPEEIRAYYGAVASLKQQNKDPLTTGKALSSKQNPDILALVLADYQYQNRLFAEADTLIKAAKSLPAELQNKASQLQQRISNDRIIQAVSTEDYAIARDITLAQLKLTPEQPTFLKRLVSIETLAGQYTEADKVLKQVESILPNDYQVVVLQSQLALAQKDKAKAEQLLKTEWNKNKEEEVGVELYKFYQIEDKSKATAFLSEWLTSAPASVYANLNYGMELQAKGDNSAAIKAYEKVLAVAPNELTSLNNAAWLYSLSKDPKAEELAAKAYQVAPNNAAVLDTYGWILFETGKVEEAKPFIKRALELLPDNVEIQQHWAEALK